MAHELTTGPEIVAALNGQLDAIVLGVGSSGTVSGLGRYFKAHAPHVELILADPVGSVLADYINARHVDSAARIAAWLEADARVERVLYPGLPSHPHYALASRQMRAGGGIVTFRVRGGIDNARRFLEDTELFALAESLGGVESLVDHPGMMTHASVPPERRAELGISDTLIRLSVGIEALDDLLADLDRALSCAAGAAESGP